MKGPDASEQRMWQHYEDRIRELEAAIREHRDTVERYLPNAAKYDRKLWKVLDS